MYAQVLGFGTANINQLVEDNSPLSTLASRFISQKYALLIDFAVISSAFACTMGTLAAASQMLMALSLDSRLKWFKSIDRKHGTPWKALLAISTCSLVGTLIYGSHVGGVTYAVECASIASMALIVVYLFVCFAELIASCSARSPLRIATSGLCIPLLIWPLFNSVYPIPKFPDSLWPYIVAAWILAGTVLARDYKTLQNPTPRHSNGAYRE
jgi:amino acid transporter